VTRPDEVSAGFQEAHRFSKRLDSSRRLDARTLSIVCRKSLMSATVAHLGRSPYPPLRGILRASNKRRFGDASRTMLTLIQ